MTGHIFIYGPIGTERGAISLKSIQDQIDPTADGYELHFRSEGGDVDEGFAIYNYLKGLGKPVNKAIVETLCASISTLVASVADKIVMKEKSQFMIHNPKITEITQPADSKYLRSVANRLDSIKTLLIDDYQKRTGLPKEKLWELYDEETWLNPQQAVDLGFADEIEPALRAVAKINLTESVKMEKKHENLFTRITNFFKTQKVKNEMVETLEDGRVIVVMSEDGDWTGKQVMQQDGSPLEPGAYKLTTGKTFTVGTDGTITEVKDPEPPQNQEPKNEPTNEDMEKDKQIAELEAKLAALKGEKEAAEAIAANAEARAAKVENRVKTMESDFLKMKEEMEKTFGSTTPPGKGPTNKFATPKVEDYDPMGEEALKYLKGHNRI